MRFLSTSKTGKVTSIVLRTAAFEVKWNLTPAKRSNIVRPTSCWIRRLNVQTFSSNILYDEQCLMV